MKHNKNADTLLFLLSFPKSQRKKILKNIFCDCKCSKGSVGSGNTLPQDLANSKNKLPVKFIFTQSIFVILSTAEKA